MKFEIYSDTKGEFRWRMKADNGQIIATAGESYKNKADCKHGVTLVKENAAAADVEEAT